LVFRISAKLNIFSGYLQLLQKTGAKIKINQKKSFQHKRDMEYQALKRFETLRNLYVWYKAISII